MHQLYLVQTVDPYGPNKFLPLAIAYQWLYARNPDWEVADTLIEKLPIQEYVDSMKAPAMVAMSCYVWNWEYSRALAQAVKKRFPETIIVVGGPQVPKADPGFFKAHPYFDLAVHGEGEKAFREILLRYPHRDFTGIPHVQTPDSMPPRKLHRIEELDSIPSPMLSGFYDTILAKYPADTRWQASIETMRGCPYRCAYCDMGDLYWNKAQMFSLERVLREIDWLSEKKIEYVTVCDSNWGMFPRDLEITRYVVDKKKATGFPKVWDATIAKNNSRRNFEMALINKESGTNLFKGVTFAMQSFSPAALEATRRFNLKEEEVSRYLQEYKKRDIPTYSELIWPLPGETYESLKNGIQKLIDLGQDDFLMVHPLVLTPNAPLAAPTERERYGLRTREALLDTYFLDVKRVKEKVEEKTEVVFETHAASAADVERGFLFSYVLIVFYYYGWGHYLAKYICREEGLREVDLFERLLCWIEANPQTMVGGEYLATQESFRLVYGEGGQWGRQVLGDDDILWEYKSATSVVFQRNRGALAAELKAFLRDSFPRLSPAAVDLNLALCCDQTAQYPHRIDLDPAVSQAVLGIPAPNIEVSRPPGEGWSTERDFYHVAYHYQRKNRYWRNRWEPVKEGTIGD